MRGSTHIKELFKCNPHRVPANRIEEAVTNNLKELLTKPDFAQALLDKARQAHRKRMEASEVKEYQRKICGYKGQLEALVERISDLPQDISPLPFYRKMRKIEELQQKAETALREAKTREGMSEEAPAGLKDYRSYLKLIERAWGGDGGNANAGTAEWKSKLIKRLIHRVNIAQDSVEVYYYVGEDKITAGGGGSRNLTNGADSPKAEEPLNSMPYVSIFITHFLNYPAQNLEILRKLAIDFRLTPSRIELMTDFQWPKDTVFEALKKNGIKRQGPQISSRKKFGVKIVQGLYFPNQKEQKIIKEMLALREQGNTFDGIANLFNLRGISGSQGGKWSAATVRAIIKRESEAQSLTL